MSFLFFFNRSKVRNITMGKPGGNKLGGNCRPRAGTLELQEISLEKSRQMKSRRERDWSDGHGQDTSHI